eukprot:CAMPEP_0170120176 /NCGR_PEP_ID=MMETSP0020_2-20130122/14960_1 /TAXON_ID=98059 /ORGANISM="Dinobryon sp., Strain UTEXLB2267" /LENGTH=41 /DNA_ID= /DNA_START= /DNA_END= /DNA_ORIENTATION=
MNVNGGCRPGCLNNRASFRVPESVQSSFAGKRGLWSPTGTG